MAHAATNNGNQSAREIEREVDAERQRVSETIDALQRKVSVGNIVDQVVKSVGEHGGEAGHNLTLTLRQNPMAVLLTGVGLAWLIAGNGPRRSSDGDDDSDDYARRARAGGYSPGAGDPLSRFEYPGDESLGDSVRTVEASDETLGDHDWSKEGPGMGERIAGAAASVSESLGAASDAIRESGAGVGARVSRLAGRAGDAAGHAARHAPDMGEARRRLGQTGRSGLRGLETFFDEQPLVVGALALALGAAIGGALPRTRTEDELFGEESDRLKRSLRATAEEERERLSRSASAVADEARNMAGEASDELARSGAAAVDRVDRALGEASDRLRQRAGEARAEDATPEKPAEQPHEEGAGQAPPRGKDDEDAGRPGFPR